MSKHVDYNKTSGLSQIRNASHCFEHERNNRPRKITVTLHSRQWQLSLTTTAFLNNAKQL